MEITKQQQKHLAYYENLMNKPQVDEYKEWRRIRQKSEALLDNNKAHEPMIMFINHLNKNIDKCDITEVMLDKEVQFGFDNYISNE